MKLIFILNFLFGFFSFVPMQTATSDPVAPKVFPVPPTNDNSLFYIQRTKNTNAIVYDLNRLPDGKINVDEPVKVYWIRYASDSTTAELTYIQRKYAYGVNIKQYDKTKNSFVLQLVAYKKRNIFLIPTGNNRYTALMSINGKFAEIKRIFVSISGGTFWFPKVDYIELAGKDPVTHQKTVERFVP